MVVKRKQHLPRLTNPLALTLLVLAVGGCASGPQRHLLPDEGPTTKDVYENHLMNSGKEELRQKQEFRALNGAMQAPRDIDMSRWTRTVENEMTLKFPRIPNAELFGYVFPHLSTNGHPIPGYSTSFPLYETYHYALPGEVAPVEPGIKGTTHYDR